MGTVMNSNKWIGACVNGNVVSGLAKNGVAFYKKTTSNYLLLEYTDTSDIEHTVQFEVYNDLKNFVSQNRTTLKACKLSSVGNLNATSIAQLFYNCTNLQSVDLSNFDTSDVVNMTGLFLNCYSLETLNLNNFDTSKVTNMSDFFMNCRTLTTLNLSNFDKIGRAHV